MVLHSLGDLGGLARDHPPSLERLGRSRRYRRRAPGNGARGMPSRRSALPGGSGWGAAADTGETPVPLLGKRLRTAATTAAPPALSAGQSRANDRAATSSRHRPPLRTPASSAVESPPGRMGGGGQGGHCGRRGQGGRRSRERGVPPLPSGVRNHRRTVHGRTDARASSHSYARESPARVDGVDRMDRVDAAKTACEARGGSEFGVEGRG